MSSKDTELTLDGINTLAAEIRAGDGPGTQAWDRGTSHTNRFNEAVVDALRENKGKVPGELEKATLLIITTIGAKSGEKRTVPLSYVVIDGRLLLIASMGGAQRNPPWYHNLVKHPEVLVEKDGVSFSARAVVTEGEDRDRLFGIICQRIPNFADYQTRTDRVIPVVELVR